MASDAAGRHRTSPSYREPPSSSALLRAWRKVPVLLRAPVLGFAIMSLGVAVWQGFARMNLSVWPDAPWSVAATAVFLLFYWRYFGGRGWPKATAETRRLSMRAHPVAPDVRPLIIAAALVGLGFTASLHFLSLRFIDLPAEGLSLVPRGIDVPWWTLWPMVVMISVVAGVCEEIGVRGYIQTPLESRHGVIVAILLSSAVFTAMHFNREVGLALAAPIFVSALWYGALTAAANSILPMVFVHTVLDIVLLFYHDILKGPLPAAFAETGYTEGVLVNAGVAGGLGLLLVILIGVVAVRVRAVS